MASPWSAARRSSSPRSDSRALAASGLGVLGQLGGRWPESLEQLDVDRSADERVAEPSQRRRGGGVLRLGSPSSASASSAGIVRVGGGQREVQALERQAGLVVGDRAGAADVEAVVVREGQQARWPSGRHERRPSPPSCRRRGRAGSRVARSATRSRAKKTPSPRTSPMTGCRSASSRSPGRSTSSPMRRACSTMPLVLHEPDGGHRRGAGQRVAGVGQPAGVGRARRRSRRPPRR